MEKGLSVHSQSDLCLLLTVGVGYCCTCSHSVTHNIHSVGQLRCASAGSPDATPAEPYPNSNTQQSKNNTANVVVQQHSRILLKMDILMPETCTVRSKVDIT